MDNSSIEKEMDQLKSDLSSLRSDVASLLEVIRESGVEKARETYDQAYERAQRSGEKVKMRAEETYSQISQGVEERPLVSLLASFATGFIVGMLLDQRRH